jgi:hypothetical protein
MIYHIFKYEFQIMHKNMIEMNDLTMINNPFAHIYKKQLTSISLN